MKWDWSKKKKTKYELAYKKEKHQGWYRKLQIPSTHNRHNMKANSWMFTYKKLRSLLANRTRNTSNFKKKKKRKKEETNVYIGSHEHL